VTGDVRTVPADLFVGGRWRAGTGGRGLVSEPAAPSGGVKQSGLGREGGTDGLLEFLEAKYIATRW
jgi:succinate-semialdehyde dehydrogenase / glutarate-semialdehyde dehydrogenase